MSVRPNHRCLLVGIVLLLGAVGLGSRLERSYKELDARWESNNLIPADVRHPATYRHDSHHKSWPVRSIFIHSSLLLMFGVGATLTMVGMRETLTGVCQIR